MLVIRNLRFKYFHQIDYALDIDCLSCQSEGITTIVGSSGVGKSTLMALIAGILSRSDALVSEFTGEITIDELLPSALRGPSMVSWVPQEPVLLDHLTVLDNVLLPLTITPPSTPNSAIGLSLLSSLGIKDSAHSRPRSLSGGMRTRVSLARALASDPRYLFLDEPFTGIDLMNRWNIFGILLELRKKQGLSTIMTSHDIPESMILSDRIIVLKRDVSGHHANLIELSSPPPSLENPIECLRMARQLAAPIEAQLM